MWVYHIAKIKKWQNQMKLINKFAVRGINFYQKWLSPHKGYSCAHRQVHGGLSCSEYVKQAFLHNDLKTSIELANQRFHACGQASKVSSQTRPDYLLKMHRMSRRNFMLLMASGLFFTLVSPALAARRRLRLPSNCLASIFNQICRDAREGNDQAYYSQDDASRNPDNCLSWQMMLGCGLCVGLSNMTE